MYLKPVRNKRLSFGGGYKGAFANDTQGLDAVDGQRLLLGMSTIPIVAAWAKCFAIDCYFSSAVLKNSTYENQSHSISDV